ncbi:low molecular weight phosphatase family protein, partial [Rhizobium ruizarguesonis]
ANTYIRSAGVRAGKRDPFVDAVLEEIGLSLGRSQPQTLEELEDDYFDLIITLSPHAHQAVLELTRSSAVEVVYWPTM